jgi:cytochrome c oxidase subunit 2
LLVAFLFAWGTSLGFGNRPAPNEAIEVSVLGQQWMWKFQHPEGRQEINELHVSLGRPVRLSLTSRDVSHTLSIPAFRLKTRIPPGRSAWAWFQATRAGQYHLFCAEYCGARHSQMQGAVIVMDPRAYQQWVSGETEGASPASLGQRFLAELKCDACHRPDGAGRGPSLEGLFGRTVTLRDGRTLVADEAYVRESILNPGAKLVANFEPVMPAFQGQLTEEQLLRILAYLQTLQGSGPGGPQR